MTDATNDEQEDAAGATRSLDAGEVLFAVGAPGDHAYYVEEGALEAWLPLAGDDAEPLLLETVRAGGFVGVLEVLQAVERCAEVRASAPCRLTPLGRQAFLDRITADPEELATVIHSVSVWTRKLFDVTDARIEATRGMSWRTWLSTLLGGMFGVFRRRLVTMRGRQERRVSSLITEEGRTTTLSEGAVLFHEGAPSGWAGRLVSGRLIARKRVGEQLLDLGFVEPGQLVGELGLLGGRPRSATVVATEPVEIEMLSEKMLLARLAADAELGRQALYDLASRALRLTVFLTEIDAADTAPRAVLRLGALLGSVEAVARLAGEVVEHDLKRLRHGLKTEARSVRDMVATYQRFVRDEASREEMEAANAAFRNVLKTMGVGTLFLLPGGLITIALVAKLGQRFGIDVLPQLELDQLPDAPDAPVAPVAPVAPAAPVVLPER